MRVDDGYHNDDSDSRGACLARSGQAIVQRASASHHYGEPMTPEIARRPAEEPERFRESEDIRLGAWAWVYDREPADDGEIEGWLGCVTHVGSNYLQITEPHTERQSYHKSRIHFDDIAEMIEVEPDPEGVIKENVEEQKGEVQLLINKAKNLLEGLGLRDRMLPSPDMEQSTALVLASSVPDVKEHKRALVMAKDKTLPDIFKQIEDANGELVRWMSARALPMIAQADQARGVVDQIEDRVFTIELYAGLLEDVKLVRRGKPAPLGEKLRIMQRRCYMDEECLLGYRSGGIDISDLSGFDEWLGERENFERVLPFQRCMVAFRVRRHVKEREWDGTFGGAFLNVRLEQQDKLTFLYIRNGRRLYRLNTELELGPKIFPDRDEHVLQDKMWAKMFAGKIDRIMPDREYQDRLEELRDRERDRKHKESAWKKKNPGKGWIHNPHSTMGDSLDLRRLEDCEPYDPSSVYYDDIHDHIGKRIKAYNRIAVIVQGLFDRSKVLHPHAPVRLWDADGFAAAVELVYDSDRTLYPSAEPPDFEEYRARLNESLETGSATVGQEEHWERGEAVKYMRSRYAPNHTVKRHSPYGNPGPGFLSRVARWMPHARKAVFRWERERQGYHWRYGQRTGPIQCQIAVPSAKLMNVGAYVPGDFKQFYEDPRTRAGYLRWAEMLLAAEEFYAGNLEVTAERRDD